MAGADVVDRNLDTEPLECSNNSPRLGEILERLTLGHLEHDLGELQQRMLENLADVVDDLLAGEMTSRQVEANLEMRPHSEHGARILTDATHQRSRHLDDEATRLRERNKCGGRHDSAVGLAPTDQHLRSAQSAGTDVNDRLEIRHELAGLHRPQSHQSDCRARAGASTSTTQE